jgi:hypothetical protein
MAAKYWSRIQVGRKFRSRMAQVGASQLECRAAGWPLGLSALARPSLCQTKVVGETAPFIYNWPNA